MAATTSDCDATRSPSIKTALTTPGYAEYGLSSIKMALTTSGFVRQCMSDRDQGRGIQAGVGRPHRASRRDRKGEPADHRHAAGRGTACGLAFPLPFVYEDRQGLSVVFPLRFVFKTAPFLATLQWTPVINPVIRARLGLR